MEQHEDRLLRVDMTSLTTAFEPYPEAWKLLGGRYALYTFKGSG